MGRLMSQELDRHRPLWETWMVEGLADGTWALISKVHHCMVDGMSGTDLMAVVLDSSADGTPPIADDWRPAPEPSDAALVRDALMEPLLRPSELVRWGRAAIRTPRRLLDDAGEVLGGLRSLGATLVPNVELPIEGTIGPHRRWTAVQTTLDEVKQVRAAHGGTVNDVVLAAITGGYRDLLLARGEQLDGVVVRTLVPVSVRASGDHTLNNQVASIIAELPVGIADPIERLHAVRTSMHALKAGHQAEASRWLFDLADHAPAPVLSVGLRTAVLVMRRLPQRSVNTVTTNVPGPQHALYACGREMLEYLPFVPLAQGVRTGVAILSYHGRISFGITADWDTVPDLDVLAGGIEQAMRELLDRSRPVTTERTTSRRSTAARRTGRAVAVAS
jgi:diacylglycerol O-acyltransferase